MNWFVLSIPCGFGISLIIMEWEYMAEVLPVGILSTTGGVILFITLWVGYRQYLRTNNYKMHTNLYAFYKSVRDYVEWYDSNKAASFITEQKKCLDELEKYLEVNEKKFSSNVVKQVSKFRLSFCI